MNSLNEDIKILEEYLIYMRDVPVGENVCVLWAIENLIKGYRELEKITNGIKVLETNGVNDDTFYVIAKTDFLNGNYKHLLDDYIPKSKIKEKIDELEKELTHDITRNDGFAEYREYAIDILEELMEAK